MILGLLVVSKCMQKAPLCLLAQRTSQHAGPQTRFCPEASPVEWPCMDSSCCPEGAAQLSMQASALTTRQPKRTKRATFALYMVGLISFEDVVSGCAGWRCFVDVMMDASRATRGISIIIPPDKSRQAPYCQLSWALRCIWNVISRHHQSQYACTVWTVAGREIVRHCSDGFVDPTEWRHPPHSDGPERVGMESVRK